MPAPWNADKIKLMVLTDYNDGRNRNEMHYRLGQICKGLIENKILEAYSLTTSDHVWNWGSKWKKES